MSKLFEMGRESLERQAEHCCERARLLLQAGKVAEANHYISRARVYLRQLQRVLVDEMRGKQTSVAMGVEEGSGFTIVEPDPDSRRFLNDLEAPAFTRNGGAISLVDVARNQWNGKRA